MTAGLVTVCLFVISFWERTEGLAWGTLAMGALTSYYFSQYTRPDSQYASLGLAGTAIVLTVVSYLVGEGRTHIWYRPTRLSAHLLVVCALVSWLVLLSSGRANSLVLDNLSWLLGLIGVNYLLVSTLEGRDKPDLAVTLRYLGYGAIVLIEATFVLRLVLGSVTQLQYYVLPVGLTCMILAWIERRHLNNRTAPLLEALGLIIVIGTTLLQSFDFQTVGIDSTIYGIWLIVECVAILGYGAANRLRYYFFGSITVLVIEVVSLSVDPIRAADKWLVLGVTGLFLVVVALLLERKREAVIKLSKDWIHHLKEWQ